MTLTRLRVSPIVRPNQVAVAVLVRRPDRLVRRKTAPRIRLGMLSSAEYEPAHYATFNREPQPP